MTGATDRAGTFLDFYDFHLRHRAHPGGVYYLFPYLRDRYGWDDEAALWFAFINGNTQNPVTSLILHRRAPSPRHADRLLDFWAEHRERLAWDTDRRYHRTKLDTSVIGYLAQTGGALAPYWRARADDWAGCWAAATAIPTFGRLSAWSFIEYLRIMGYGADAADLMLGDLSGSRSHRNGLAIVSGHPEWDWHKSNPAFPGTSCYTPDVLGYLGQQAETLLGFARERAAGTDYEDDVSRLTLESALCTYKSWHRPNRRYPNVYNDMLYGRIKAAEQAWPGEDLDVFWEARADRLPRPLRLEDNPLDPGVHPIKQNHYLHTGEPVVMYAGSPRESGFDRDVRVGAYGRFR